MNKFKHFLTLHGKSAITAIGYASDISKCVANQITDKKLSFINIDKLTSMSLSPNSKHRYLSSLKKYAKYLLYKKEIANIPTELLAIELPPIVKNNPKMPSKDQLTKTLNSTNDIEIKLLIHLLYSTGARIRSISNLKVEDIQEDHIVFTNKKSGREFVSILTPEVKILLQQYLREKEINSGYIFKETRGEQATPSCLRHRLQRSLGKNYINPHGFRHRIATDLLENGVDLYDVKDFLDHSNVNTTLRYIHTSIEHKKKSLVGKHPMLCD